MTSIRPPEWALVACGMLVIVAATFYPVEALLAVSGVLSATALALWLVVRRN